MNYTYEKRQDLAVKLCRLSLFYLHRHAFNEESFREILNQQLPIYRLTTLWDGKNHPADACFFRTNSEWDSLVDALWVLYEKNESNSAVFEERGLGLLSPYIQGRIQTDIENWPWIPCGYSPKKLPQENVFDVFAYDEINSAGQGVVSFHIANSCLPESPFKDMNARAKELRCMVRAIKKRIPSAKKITCNSWLNSFEPFLTLFPASYPRENAIHPVSYGFNWWGQFISRDGRFHDRHGKIMRETGAFPFLSRTGLCDMEHFLPLKRSL